MFDATARADMKPHMEAAHQARSRAFFDLMTWIRKRVTKLWTKRANKNQSVPSGVLQA